MKLRTILLLLLSVFLFLSCGNSNSDGEIIESTEVDEIPNLSDIHFEEALTAFKGNDIKNAARHIRDGIAALQKEATDTTRSVNQAALKKSVEQLNQLASDIQADKVRDTDRLREAFANAALTISHDYLVFDDIYFLEKPEKVDDIKLNRDFDKAVKSFSVIKKNLPESAKMEADRIETETESLRAKRAELDRQISDHLQNMHSFVKQHKPDEARSFPYYEFE